MKASSVVECDCFDSVTRTQHPIVDDMSSSVHSGMNVSSHPAITLFYCLSAMGVVKDIPVLGWV